MACGNCIVQFACTNSKIPKLIQIFQLVNTNLKLVNKLNPFFRLKDLLRLRLTECGWNDEVRLLARDVIKEDGGNVNVEEITKQITPKARALVPDTVKRELLQKIKTILSTQAGVDV